MFKRQVHDRTDNKFACTPPLRTTDHITQHVHNTFNSWAFMLRLEVSGKFSRLCAATSEPPSHGQGFSVA